MVMVTDLQRDAILDGVRSLLRPTILADGRFTVASCVLTTRVAYEVLRTLQVDADVLAAEVRVINAPLAVAMRAALEDGRDPQALGLDEVPNGHAVFLGTTRDVDREGHVILLADNDLLDLSLDQATRPQYGLQLEPLWIRLAADEMAELRAGTPVTVQLDDGTVIVYLVRLRDRWYTASPNWGRRDRLVRRRIAGHVVRRIREKLGPDA